MMVPIAVCGRCIGGAGDAHPLTIVGATRCDWCGAPREAVPGRLLYWLLPANDNWDGRAVIKRKSGHKNRPGVR
jgi:hypothetical protein